MDDIWNLVGYVRSSQYRDDTVRFLFDAGPSMPSELSDRTGHALPHVSRALSQLREREIVALLVPEDTRRGRIYGLTDAGESVAEQLLRDRNEFAWSVVDEGTFRYAELVSFVRSVAEEAFRAVAYRDGRQVELVVDDGVDDPNDPALVSGPQWGPRYRSDAPEYRYYVGGFADRTLVRIAIDDGESLGIALDAGFDVVIPEFVDRCLDRIA